MNHITHATSLYNFLRECNKSKLRKEVLDCGAGGEFPPLSIFYQKGYKTHGIDISDRQLDKAKKFCKANNMNLDIVKGDMKRIPFENESMSFIYFYNSIHHMTKNDIKISLNEIERVLKKGGLCFVNFPSVESCRFGKGKVAGKGEFIVIEDDDKYTYCFFEEEEADMYFKNYEIIHKEKRIVYVSVDVGKHRQAFIDYIVRKK